MNGLNRRLGIGLIVLAIALLAPAPGAQESAPARRPDPPISGQQAFDSVPEAAAPSDGPPAPTHPLLAPVEAGAPELAWLQERRRWLAHQPADVAVYRQVAEQLAERKAWFPAIEILWFAEKIAQDAATREALNRRMVELEGQTREVGQRIDTAVQLWGAGHQPDALATLQKIRDEYPYAEQAYYHSGLLLNQTYQQQVGKAEEAEQLPPLEIRRQLFQVIHRLLASTILIDPLFYDAYYQLSLLRSLMPDDAEFVRQSDVLSQRAMTFYSQLMPAMEVLDGGDRSAAALARAAEAFTQIGAGEYAVYAWQAALAQPDITPELAAQGGGAIERIRAEGLGGAGGDGGVGGAPSEGRSDEAEADGETSSTPAQPVLP